MVERVRIQKQKKLRGFQPGHKHGVGNGGRKVRKWLTQSLVRELNDMDPRTRRNNYRLVAQALVTAGIAGDMVAVKEIFNRVEGRVPMGVEMSGPDGEPIQNITSNMTPAEAAKLYADTLVNKRND